MLRALDEVRFAGRDPDVDPDARADAEDRAAAWLHDIARACS